jgi:hypothetical protein
MVAGSCFWTMATVARMTEIVSDSFCVATMASESAIVSDSFYTTGDKNDSSKIVRSYLLLLIQNRINTNHSKSRSIKDRGNPCTLTPLPIVLEVVGNRPWECVFFEVSKMVLLPYLLKKREQRS